MKIIQEHEVLEVGPLTIVVCGAPGVGKTTTSLTAYKPLLLDFDGGAYRAGVRAPTVIVSSWADVSAITAEDLEPFNTVVVDTVGRALDFIKQAVVTGDPKNRRRDGEPSMQGYGAMKAMFVNWLKSLRTMGKDIILIAHSMEEHDGDDVVERLDIVGGSKGEIYKVADVMGRIYVSNGKRMFDANPTEKAFGKNPGQLAPMQVVEGTNAMAEIIAKTRAKLETMSAEQVEVQKLLDEWQKKLGNAEGVEDFNALIELSKETDERIQDKAKILLVDAARKAGCVLNRKAALFEVAA